MKLCFKPYYKWNTFNTEWGDWNEDFGKYRFKPYYKWNTFNTMVTFTEMDSLVSVLNLIINGIPSILKENAGVEELYLQVLNLIINGIPSILERRKRI